MAKPSAQTARLNAKLAKAKAKGARTAANEPRRDARVALLTVGLISWQAKGARHNAHLARDNVNVARDDTSVARHNTKVGRHDIDVAWRRQRAGRDMRTALCGRTKRFSQTV
ncbi:MAG: hypothetical protein ACJ796_21795 [Gemmatimonadaceae bacterium]